MKRTFLVLALALTSGFVFAQKKTTTSATVVFDATTPKDALPKAENKTVIGSIDTKTGAVAFEAAVKNFAFSNPKVQEHFNGANWMKSDEFPKFSYTGSIENINKLKLTKNGNYTVSVKGNLTVKGISKEYKVPGTITVENGKLKVAANFVLKLKDFNITGQPIEAGKVATEPKVTVTAEF